MKSILAFGASSSKNSINKTLANYAAGLIDNAEVKLLDLNDFDMPIFSVDRENENGIHPLAVQFKEEIKAADGILISLAEHNSAYSAAFKNIYDWVSRLAPDVWEGKPMFLLATAPGPWGGKSVLKLAYDRFSRRNRNTIETFSLPEFSKNFSVKKGILNSALKTEFEGKLEKFSKAVLL